MESLAINSVLAHINNMSYDERERLKDLIVKERLDSYFYIQGPYYSERYLIQAENKKSAKNKFIKSDKFITHNIRTFFVLDYIDHKLAARCKICDELLLDLDIGENGYLEITEKQFEKHFGSHIEKTFEFYAKIFKEHFSCHGIQSEIPEITKITQLDMFNEI